MPVNGAQGGSGDAEMAPAPAGGRSGNGGLPAAGCGAQDGDVNVLRRFSPQVGNIP